MRLFKRHKRIVQAVVLLLIGFGMGSIIWKSWTQLTHYSWHVQWGLLLAGFALLVAQEISYAFIWRDILRRMGSRLDIISSQRIYLGAEFVRYIPGNVWHVITRVMWSEQRGVPKPVGFASMVVELATKISAAALVFALSLFLWSDTHVLTSVAPSADFIVAAAVLVPLLLLGMHPRLLGSAFNFGLRKLGREPVTLTLSYRDILLVTLAWGVSWVVAGAGFYLLVRSLVSTPLPASALWIAAGIYALGWDIGFVSFVTPSGLGFRETAIAYLLAASLFGLSTSGLALGMVIALIARLLSTGAELLCISGAHIVPVGPAPTAPEPAQQGG
jgi:uncharacterized membrane protein YbhN (UPF0104 family)